jgi:hypothetical protein
VKSKRITEAFLASVDAGSQVDREAGVIRNVLICGPKSANNREYPPAVLKRDFARYEGAKVYYDHSRGERRVNEAAGWFSNVKPDAAGLPRGDLNIFKSDANANKIFEAAERNPTQFSMSHVVDVASTFRGTTEVIESIDRVVSVDIVTDAATTKGFFRSEGKAMKIKLSDLSARLLTKPGAKAKAIARFESVCEMEGYGDVEMDAPGDDTSADQDVEAALQTLAASLLKQAISGDITAEDAGSKITAFIKTHKGEAAAETEPDDDAAEESKKAKGKKPIAEAFDAAKFKTELLADVRALMQEERPRSGGKVVPKSESTAKLPDDAKTLNEFLKSA